MERIPEYKINDIKAVLGILSARHNADSPRVADARRRALNTLKWIERREERERIEKEMKAQAKKSTGSQRKAILEALLSGRRITSDDAQKICGSRRLGARIYEIRHDLGYAVKMRMIPNPDGNEYAEYWIENEAERESDQSV